MKDIWINTLAEFCGVRDIRNLTKEDLMDKYQIAKADVMVLFGGSIICGGDVLAEAMNNNIAKKYIIVGGAGHTTQALRDVTNQIFPDMDTAGKTEAVIFNEYIRRKYGLEADLLECKSTNCGNNITFLIDLLEENGIECSSIILSQDATMQRRMAATLRKYKPEWTIINYATYQAFVEEKDEGLLYKEDASKLDGMWEMDRYITLLMGEIPRLTDDENGYGPKGKGFIAHEDIPLNVQNAFFELKEIYKDSVREANPEFASAK